jgi:RimJ/RimL family protein N-acetyltransferase
LGWRSRASGAGEAWAGLSWKRSSTWARESGVHRVSLEVFAHNEAAIALYRRLGFVEEGRLRKQYRRTSGELWDVVVMGRLL